MHTEIRREMHSERSAAGLQSHPYGVSFDVSGILAQPEFCGGEAGNKEYRWRVFMVA
jgi:hypothetical protein